MDAIRLAVVSAINESAGMVRVIYNGDSGASAELSVLSFGGIYRMPQKGDMVLVATTKSGDGVVLGTFFNEQQKPSATGDFVLEAGNGAALRAAGGNAEIKGTEVRLSGAGGSITVTELVAKLQELEARLAALGG